LGKTVTRVRDEIVASVTPVVEGLGFDLVDLTVARAGRRQIVRVLADKPTGGIGLDDCARISRALGAALETADLIRGPFTLEVSSPGLDRRLTEARDFRRYTGEEMTLQLEDGRQVKGVLSEVTEEHLTLGDGGEAIPLAQVRYGTRNY
jgi:ribosome maturation factor RimP